MRRILSFMLNSFRILFWVTLTPTVFALEYLFVKDDERVEWSNTSLLAILYVPIVFAMVGFIEAGLVIDNVGISGAYTFIWSWVHRSASLARQYFPGLVTLRIFNVLKALEEGLSMIVITIVFFPIILPLALIYKLLGPPILRYLWYPLFTQYVPAFYLFLNKRHYETLDPGRSTIRLLELLPGEPSDPIRCRLIHADVHDADFEAVSYTWGGHLVFRRQIFVDDRSFWVTQNILLALRAFRQVDTPRTLWIDQMCINQQDISEKADQITHKMHHVYRNAQRVIAWLGSSTPDIAWAIDQAKLRSTNSYQQVSVSTTKEKSSRTAEQNRYIEGWEAILERKWFRRIWIVQEVALARHLLIVCGADEMDWDVLKQTVLELKQVHGARVSHSSEKLLGFLGHPDKNTRKASLIDLAIRFNASEATYAEDKLIGLLALAEDGHHYSSIHYRYRSALVFASFTAAYMQRTRSLAILALDGNTNAPFLTWAPCSWAPDWDTGVRNLVRPAILWGVEYRPSTINRVAKYCASGGRQAICRREQGHSTDNLVRGIFLHGWYADTIKAVSIVGVSYEVSNTLSIWAEFAQHHMSQCVESDRVFQSVILGEIYDMEKGVPWSQWYVPKHKRHTSSSLGDSQLTDQRSEILESLSG